MVNQVSITSEEFHFFLDCAFRAVMIFSLAPEQIETPTQQKKFRDRQYTPHIGKRVDQSCIERVVKLLFKNSNTLNESQLVETMSSATDPDLKMLNDTLNTLNGQFKNHIVEYQKKSLELTMIKYFVKLQMV